jgi:acyl dehydratase
MSAVPATTVADLDALRAKVGSPLGVSAWRAVDQAAIDDFARVTGDAQWIHVDPRRAAAGPFGTTIAHGYLTLSLCSAFLTELLEVRSARMAVNYGLDRVRFPAPVLVGSRVRGAGTLASVDDVADGARAVIRMTVEVEGAAKPACVADLVVQFQA